MKFADSPEKRHILLTPGPLTTTWSVKAAMLGDWCTWDDDYYRLVQAIRQKLVALATIAEGYTAVLMQGSGTFTVESVLGTAIPEDGKLLVLANGAYGQRMVQIALRLRIPVVVQDSGELAPPRLTLLRDILQDDQSITHVAVVHCETTTGMLNPIEQIGEIVKHFERVFVVDAMSSFGGIPLDMNALGADFLISSANKCIQGVPGFGFVIARREELEKHQGTGQVLEPGPLRSVGNHGKALRQMAFHLSHPCGAGFCRSLEGTSGGGRRRGAPCPLSDQSTAARDRNAGSRFSMPAAPRISVTDYHRFSQPARSAL